MSSSPTAAVSADSDRDLDDVEEPEDMALGSGDEVLGAGTFSAWDMEAEEEYESGGNVVRDMRYWKPWQPPLSTVIRRARLGFASLVMISFRR